MGPASETVLSWYSEALLHHHWHPELLREGRMGPCFHDDPVIQMLQQKWRLIRPGNVFSNLQLSNFGELVAVVASVSTEVSGDFILYRKTLCLEISTRKPPVHL